MERDSERQTSPPEVVDAGLRIIIVIQVSGILCVPDSRMKGLWLLDHLPYKAPGEPCYHPSVIAEKTEDQ